MFTFQTLVKVDIVSLASEKCNCKKEYINYILFHFDSSLQEFFISDIFLSFEPFLKFNAGHETDFVVYFVYEK